MSFNHSYLNSTRNNNENTYRILNEASCFEERNAQWQNQNKAKFQETAERYAEEKYKECTFKPQTNSKSAKMVKSKYQMAGGRVSAGERLYEKRQQKVLVAQAKAMNDENEKFVQQCTF
jgi:hypothetical protein